MRAASRAHELGALGLTAQVEAGRSAQIAQPDDTKASICPSGIIQQSALVRIFEDE